MLFSFAFSVNENFIEVHYHENIKFFCQDLVDIAMKYGQCISQFKKHHLILEMAILGLEGFLLIVSLTNPYLIISIG